MATINVNEEYNFTPTTIDNASVSLIWVKNNGVWTEGLAWINNGDTWEKGMSWINIGGIWQNGTQQDGTRLLSSEDYILTDSNGVYLTTKEDE